MADEWDDALTGGEDDDVDVDGTVAPPSGQSGATAPKPVYATVEAWVTEMFGPIIRRPRVGQGWRWCPQWWQHPEAVARLEALWRSWEYLRLDGTTGMSVWWRDHCDPHLAALTDRERSPFAQCSESKGHVGEDEPLPIEPTPAGWWATEDESTAALTE